MDDDSEFNTKYINEDTNDDDNYDDANILSMVEDCLSEGMILLDPPPTTFFHSSRPCRRKDYEEAHEYLIKACQLLTKLNHVVPTIYSCCCDVYRAMIVCNHHLLSFHHSEEDKYVYLDSIRKCLLLLHCLAAQQTCTNKKWFESLPTSSYGYLQEFFQAIPMTIQNSHNNDIITIGTHPLPISLSYHDYLPSNYFNTNSNTKTTTTTKTNSTVDHMVTTPNHAFENNTNQEDIMISMDIKQLEKEESQLIDIALPSYNNRVSWKKKKKHHSSQKNTYTLKNNFHIVLVNQQVVGDKEKQNHVVKVYPNGLIVIDNDVTSRKYILTTQTKCQPNIQNQQFSIQLENVQTYCSSSSSSSHESTLQLYISPTDNDCNILSLGYNWISKIQNILQDIQQSHNNKNDKDMNQQYNHVQSLLIQEWKMDVWKPIAKKCLEQRRQEEESVIKRNHG